MANFFKEYHAEIKAQRSAKETAIEKPTYTQGQIVYIDPMYDESRNGKRYFVTYLGNDSILLAKTKKEAMSGYGYIYSFGSIVGK